MPVPIPGPEVRSDSLKVEFLPIFGRPKTVFFWVYFRGPGVHSPYSRWLPITRTGLKVLCIVQVVVFSPRQSMGGRTASAIPLLAFRAG